MSATVLSWLLLGKPDLGMTLNGCLAGLVAITAPCAFVSVGSSIIIGLIAGVLVVLAVLFFDRMRLDDPVGALSVHLVNGVFGTICSGSVCTGQDHRYGHGQRSVLRRRIHPAQGPARRSARRSRVRVRDIAGRLGSPEGGDGLRVSREEELKGLDIGEHGNEAYGGFQVFN